MESARLTITLIPTASSPDPIGRRVLQLDPRNYSAVIGRSSKVEHKNLIPAEDNAWFDNRVMSRAHAEFTAIPKFQEVYLMDTNSMHGTWVNGTKLTGGRKTLLETNDILTFGAIVSRGAEIFEPLKVRLELKWEDAPDESSLPKRLPSFNTFTVPDDDDDHASDVEIVQQPVGPKQTETTFENEPTLVQIVDSDDDDEEVVSEINRSEVSNEDECAMTSGDGSSDAGDSDKELENHAGQAVELPNEDNFSIRAVDGASTQGDLSEQTSIDENPVPCNSPSPEIEHEQEASPPTSPQVDDAHSSEEEKQPDPSDVQQLSTLAERCGASFIRQPVVRVGSPKLPEIPQIDATRSSEEAILPDSFDIGPQRTLAEHGRASLAYQPVVSTGTPKPLETIDPRKDIVNGDKNDQPPKTDSAIGTPLRTENRAQTTEEDWTKPGMAPSLLGRDPDWASMRSRHNAILSQAHQGLAPSGPGLDPAGFWDRHLIGSTAGKAVTRGQPPVVGSFARSLHRGSSTSPTHLSPYPHARRNPYYTQGPFAPPVSQMPMPSNNPMDHAPQTPPPSTNFGPFDFDASVDASDRAGACNAHNCPPPAGGYSGRGLPNENIASRNALFSARLGNMLDRMHSIHDANVNAATSKSRPLSVSRSDPRTIVQEGGENSLKRKHNEIEAQVEVKPVEKQDERVSDVPGLVVSSTAAPTRENTGNNKSEPSVQPTAAQQIVAKAAEGTTSKELAEDMEDRPCKRVKTTHAASNMTRYAATALAGVVVGGIGTVMALAALPAGFFE